MRALLSAALAVTALAQVPSPAISPAMPPATPIWSVTEGIDTPERAYFDAWTLFVADIAYIPRRKLLIAPHTGLSKLSAYQLTLE